jgi:hypothetical protein
MPAATGADRPAAMNAATKSDPNPNRNWPASPRLPEQIFRRRVGAVVDEDRIARPESRRAGISTIRGPSVKLRSDPEATIPPRKGCQTACEMCSAERVDQLRGDADAVAGPVHRSF